MRSKLMYVGEGRAGKTSLHEALLGIPCDPGQQTRYVNLSTPLILSSSHPLTHTPISLSSLCSTLGVSMDICRMEVTNFTRCDEEESQLLRATERLCLKKEKEYRLNPPSMFQKAKNFFSSAPKMKKYVADDSKSTPRSSSSASASSSSSSKNAESTTPSREKEMATLDASIVNEVMQEVNAKVQKNITTASVMRLETLQAGGGEGGHADHITFTTWDFGGQVNGPTVPCLEFIQ